MPDLYDDEAFEAFCTIKKRRLAAIARCTRGEAEPGDVKSIAWEMAGLIQSQGDIEIDFLNPDCQDRIIAYTYQKLVAYAEKTVRYAIRLDHGPPGADDTAPTLMERLRDPGSPDPVEQLIAWEEYQEPPTVDPHRSCACAYVLLLRHFNGRMPAVAHFLRISVSHTYRCCARARQTEVQQIPISMHVQDAAFQPRPWRSFKLCRVPRQLALDFGEGLFDKDSFQSSTRSSPC